MIVFDISYFDTCQYVAGQLTLFTVILFVISSISLSLVYNRLSFLPFSIDDDFKASCNFNYLYSDNISEDSCSISSFQAQSYYVRKLLIVNPLSWHSARLSQCESFIKSLKFISTHNKINHPYRSHIKTIVTRLLFKFKGLP